jgi:large subunit ribosomal protein L53
MKGVCAIDHKIITDEKTQPCLKVTFKDKKTLETDPSAMTFTEITAIMDRHSRALQIKESIEA